MKRILAFLFGAISLYFGGYFFSGSGFMKPSVANESPIANETSDSSGNFGAITFGQPDAWFRYEWNSGDFSQVFYPLSWSFGAGILSFICFSISMKLFKSAREISSGQPMSTS